jgi:hypothetical protein
MYRGARIIKSFNKLSINRLVIFKIIIKQVSKINISRVSFQNGFKSVINIKDLKNHSYLQMIYKKSFNHPPNLNQYNT